MFILNRKFRLALQMLIDPKFEVQFNMEFFTYALISDSYDIAFFLRERYEAEIFDNSADAVDAHVMSYQKSARFLRAKLYMSKSLLQLFNFNQAKKLLSLLEYKIFDSSLENNIFALSTNPILSMVQLFELLKLISTRFFSLGYTCR